ncbi:MAG: cupredoxin domain-containing protein [Thaumarchaeota archaeon]|nr:cupredoxin domain-containing protein [Nitrososphaerota archaeon]
MRTIVFLFMVLFGITVTLPAFAQGSEVSVSITGGSEAGQSCVSAKNCYDPDILTIQPKTTVVWTNTDNTAHTVTSGHPSENDTGTVFDSGEIGPGGTYSFIFLSPGTYDYFCTLHPWMTGQVVVGLTVPNPSNTNEVMSSNNTATTPEFGPAAVLVFVASVLMVVFLAKNNLNFRS